MKEQRPENSTTKNLSAIIRFVLRPLMIVAILFVILTAGSYLIYGSFFAGWARWNGDTLYVENRILNLGTVRVGQSGSGSFRLRNLSRRPIMVLGAEADCSCVQSVELPLTIPPKSTVDFPVIFHSGENDESHQARRQLRLYLNVEQPTTMLIVQANVVSNKP
jgi:hypothetical protein